MGKFLFKYDPIKNVIELRRGSLVFDVIELDRIRERAGVQVELPKEEVIEVVTVRPLDTKAD